MAVYTPLDREEIEAFLDSYRLGLLEDFQGIPQGIENTNYLLTVSGRAYVLTLFERQPLGAVEETLRLTLELAGRGVPCPCPVTSASGLAGTLRGKPAALVPFVDGEVVWAPGEGHLGALGRALAHLHRAGAELLFSRPGPHLTEELVPLARELAGEMRDRAPELSELLSEEAEYQSGVAEARLPSGVIHADLFLDNVLFARGRTDVCALLDFHLAGRGPWLYDLAVVLLDAGWGGRGVVGDRARALLCGYRSVRPMEANEYGCLPDYLRRAALRFMCLRIQRAFLSPATLSAGAIKDPYEFAHKLRALRAG